MNYLSASKNGLHLYHLLICMLLYGFNGLAFAAPATTTGNLSGMLNRVTPAVVNIHNTFYVYEDGKRQLAKAIASGSIFSVKDGYGYVITNAHAISGDEAQLEIELSDGRFFNATVVGRASLVDLAVLKIKATDLQTLPFAANKSMYVGQDVVVVGSAFGFKETVTKGIISALQRGGIEQNEIENYIQTDAPINPGNSGGPLINLNGEMIGVNVSMYTPGKGNAGIGFAIPIDIVKIVINKILQNGKVEFSTLGIKAIDLQGSMSLGLNTKVNQGAIIVHVIPGSPAALAGLQMGDIITQMDGENIKTAAQLQSNIHLLNPGQKVEYSVARSNNEMLKITIATRNLHEFNKEVITQNQFLNDFSLEDVKAYNPIWGNISGAKINFVRAESIAQYRGFKVGDVITAVNFQTVRNIDELRQILTTLTKDPNNKSIFVTISRDFDMKILNLKAESSQHISFMPYI